MQLDARLNVPTASQMRGTVVPVSIGFLRQFAATLAAEPGTRFDASERSYDRMILLTFAACLTRRFRFALDRHNFATDLSPLRLKRDINPPPTRIMPGKAEVAEEKRRGRLQAAACLRVGQTLALFHYLRRRPI
jgi:hypothetical protein